eukprot:NODE_2704_length_891_cov_290.159091.p2 GENE.NODE_2704_length_891_cov_290.159091~~NODE_2704_length_891_cov_290.159091.p2  ORF type:complete len:270 (-),score=107.73 NODE_2704_length_891_cov_290.159091:65-772(-)
MVASERADALLHMIQSLSRDLGVQSTIFTITMHANELVQADRCTFFLLDEGKQQLWSVATDSDTEIRIPKSAGIAGECATEGKVINIPDAYEDARFNQDVDDQTGYTTQSILAVPVFRTARGQATSPRGPREVVAVIQMINKIEFDGDVGKFDEEDVQVMETFATFVAARVDGSQLVTRPERVTSEAQRAFESTQGRRSMRSAPSKRTTAIAEEDEGDDDEEEEEFEYYDDEDWG